MKSITPLFVTQLYVSNLSSVGELDISELEVSCHSIAEDDLAGQQWCEDNGYSGIQAMPHFQTLHGGSQFLVN